MLLYMLTTVYDCESVTSMYFVLSLRKSFIYNIEIQKFLANNNGTRQGWVFKQQSIFLFSRLGVTHSVACHYNNVRNDEGEP